MINEVDYLHVRHTGESGIDLLYSIACMLPPCELFGAIVGAIQDYQYLTESVTWKPIDTAPKDGTVILVKDGVGGAHSAFFTTYRGKTDWFTSNDYGWLPSAKMWMEIPQ